MKKIIITILTFSILSMFVGCGSQNSAQAEEDTNPLANQAFPKFETKDIEGNEANEQIMKGQKLTMVNIWGTGCGPCVEELPSLQKLSEEYKDKGLRMIGVVGDADSEEVQKIAKQILDESKVTYTNLIPNKTLTDEIVEKFPYIPVTLFVDKEGNIKKEFVAGAISYEDYKKVIDGLLKGEE